ncbi:MAG: arsenic efflux protein [Clostridia bacterium]|nr:arsenic efflux protein [Clostridia bacterium]
MSIHEFWHILGHGTLDSLKILPFLFVTYLLMELIEHKAGDRVQSVIKKAGRGGPAIGGALGLVPQCGFSTMAAGLYAGRVVTPGTLLAVFLATSDEMLPVFIGEGVAVTKILTVLGIKLILAMVVGFAADLLLHGRIKEAHIEELCEEEHCHCERGVLRSAIHHTLFIFLFIWIINLVLTALFELVGEEAIATAVGGIPVLGTVLAAVVGLIPNCAVSVAIATLWTKGVITGGAMLAGLLTGAGAGILVLFRTNRHLKENLLLTAALLGCGILFGVLFDLTGLAAALGL